MSTSDKISAPFATATVYGLSLYFFAIKKKKISREKASNRIFSLSSAKWNPIITTTDTTQRARFIWILLSQPSHRVSAKREIFLGIVRYEGIIHSRITKTLVHVFEIFSQYLVSFHFFSLVFCGAPPAPVSLRIWF